MSLVHREVARTICCLLGRRPGIISSDCDQAGGCAPRLFGVACGRDLRPPRFFGELQAGGRALPLIESAHHAVERALDAVVHGFHIFGLPVFNRLAQECGLVRAIVEATDAQEVGFFVRVHLDGAGL